MVRMLLTASWLEMRMRLRALTRDWHRAAALTFADSAASHLGLVGRAAEIAGGDRDDSGLPERNLGQRREKVGDPGDAEQSGRPAAGPPFAVREAARPINSLVRCRRGAVALEFVLVAPVLLLLLFAILYLGIAFNNYLILTFSAEQGAQTLSLGRGTSSPYSTAKTAITSAAANLNTSHDHPDRKDRRFFMQHR